MGNSEVGHLNLGAGRPVLQDLPRIDAAIADGSFFERPALRRRLRRAPRGRTAASTSSASIGPGGVHANDRHLVALVELAARQGVPSVRVHALLDGRDTPPRSAHRATSRTSSARLAAAHPDARIATVGGRYYAMDRDQRWERIARGYEAIVHGVGERAPQRDRRPSSRRTRAARTTSSSLPTVIDGVDGRVRDGDPIIHRQLPGRPRPPADPRPRRRGLRRLRPRRPPAPRPRDLLVVTMTEYEAGPAGRGRVPARGGPLARPRRLGRRAGASSTSPRPRSTPTSRTSSTAAARRRCPGEDRAPHPEPEGRDLRPRSPAMSAGGVADALVEAIESDAYDFIVANFANPDMVGHTGVWEATVAALATIDGCLARIVARRSSGLDAARSGRARLAPHRSPPTTATPRRCATPTASPVTAHSLNPVPIVPSGGPSRAARSTTASWPMSRRRSVELAGLARWDGDDRASLLDPTGDGRDPVLPSGAVPIRRSLPRESFPGDRPDHRQHRPDRRDPAAGAGHRPVAAHSVATRPSIAAGAASSDGCGSSRSSCSSCSCCSRSPRSSSRRSSRRRTPSRGAVAHRPGTATIHEPHRPRRHRRPRPRPRRDRRRDRRAGAHAADGRAAVGRCRACRARRAVPRGDARPARSRSTRWPPGPRSTAISSP